jgi:hypothetical protein
MAVISKGITLKYGAEGAGVEELTALTNLQEIPELGNSVRNREKIDITTLEDDEKKETDGLLEAKADEEITFKFLYDKAQFTTLNGLTEKQSWAVVLPDGAVCTFDGTCKVKLDGAGVSAALTYTLTIKPTTEMAWA